MDKPRYIAVEGPIGVGKADVARKLAESLGARLVVEDSEANPYLDKFLNDQERYAFQAQLFFLLSRFRRQRELFQQDLFERDTVADFIFERDRLYAALNLNEQDFVLYDQVFDILKGQVPQPDLVIYLSARADVLWQRVKSLRQENAWYSPAYVEDLNEAYNNFFFHYSQAPLLVVNVSSVDFIRDEEQYHQFLKVVEGHHKGVKHYIPLSEAPDGLKLGD